MLKSNFSAQNWAFTCMGSLFSGLFLSLVLPGAPALAQVSVEQSTRLSGVVEGFGRLERDDVVDGAVVVPTLRPAELMGFQIQNLLGPSEKMSAGPISVDVPGNLFFPKQKERYGWFPITLEKSSFSLFIDSNRQDELFSLWFRAPFGEAAKKAKDKAPYTELLPLVSLNGFAFEGKRDWSQVARARIALRTFGNQHLSFEWNRPQAASNEFDVLLGFQQTPAQRWMLNDFEAPAPRQGRLRRALESGDHKVLFMRVTNTPDNKKPVSVVGHFVSASSEDVFSAEGVPPSLEGVVLNGQQLSWSPLESPGWMAVLRGKQEELGYHSSEEPLSVLGDWGLRALFSLSNPLEAWVDPSAGRYRLETALEEGENLSLLFMVADRAVKNPADDTAEEPELFRHLKELRMIRLR